VITPGTVKKHVSHFLGKAGAASRTEAVARARQLGLIRQRGTPRQSRRHLCAAETFHLAAHLRVTPTAAPAPTVPYRTSRQTQPGILINREATHMAAGQGGKR